MEEERAQAVHFKQLAEERKEEMERLEKENVRLQKALQLAECHCCQCDKTVQK